MKQSRKIREYKSNVLAIEVIVGSERLDLNNYIYNRKDDIEQFDMGFKT